MKLSPEPNYNDFQLPNFNMLCKIKLNEKDSYYPFIYLKWLMTFDFICKLTLQYIYVYFFNVGLNLHEARQDPKEIFLIQR